MLEIIVQKTLEQSMYEVNTEEEISQLNYQADIHSAELVREQEWIMDQVEKLKKDKEGQVCWVVLDMPYCLYLYGILLCIVQY